MGKRFFEGDYVGTMLELGSWSGETPAVETVETHVTVDVATLAAGNTFHMGQCGYERARDWESEGVMMC